MVRGDTNQGSNISVRADTNRGSILCNISVRADTNRGSKKETVSCATNQGGAAVSS